MGVLVCLLTLCSVVTFSACGGTAEFNLASLQSNYSKVTENCKSISLSGEKIVINYSNFESGGEKYLSEVIKSTDPYKRITDFYNPLFQNSMDFAYEYLDICSKSSIKVDEQTKSELDNDIKLLKTSIKSLDDHIQTLAECVKFEYATTQNYTSISCSEGYIALFNSYDVLISVALNFNYRLANIYFSKALQTAVVDYSQVKINDFDANQAVLNFKSQLDYQKLNLTRAYFNTFVRGDALTTVFTTLQASTNSFAKPDENFTAYLSNFSAVSVDSSFENNLSTKMQIINDDQDLKTNFYQHCIAMSNAQQIINNDLRIYQIALNDVVYLNKKSDPNATDYEKFCVEMIENHNYIVGEYNEVLIDIIEIINSTGV